MQAVSLTQDRRSDAVALRTIDLSRSAFGVFASETRKNKKGGSEYADFRLDGCQPHPIAIRESSPSVQAQEDIGDGTVVLNRARVNLRRAVFGGPPK